MADLAVSAPAEQRLERHRRELTGYCYRMLGSPFEAEDAVQETMLRAWRGLDRFQGRAPLRSWLYRIATNVCRDMLSSGRRRARPVDLAPPSAPDVPADGPSPEAAWVEPVPDRLVIPERDDPAELAVARESVRLAFVAALQHLPPRQRAVLILREVLSFPATEVARLLGTTVASVNSALQRARATLAAADLTVTATEQLRPADPAQRALLIRYVDAFERYDLAALTALLHQDATMSMPPLGMWLRGHMDIRAWLLGPGSDCRGSRLVPVVANGGPAFGHYRPAGPWAVQLVEVVAGRIAGITEFLEADRLFPLFDLPPVAPAR